MSDKRCKLVTLTSFVRCAIVEWTLQNMHPCLVISNGIYASVVEHYIRIIRILDKCTHALSSANDVRGTNLQFLSEFCHFSHFNDKSQTKVRNSLMLISVCLSEFRVYE